MTFSLIIPAFNVEGYLPDCLRSIERQSFADFEVLVVDDGSTDGTGRVAREFAERDRRFKVFHKGNGGVSSARNLGLEHATGEFVWFIDGDDYIHPESLAYIDALFEKYPDTDYVTFHYEWTKKRYDGRFPPLKSICKEQPKYFDCTQSGAEWTLSFAPTGVCGACYRRGLTLGCHFQKICIAEDRLYAIEMSLRANRIITSNARIYYYHQRAHSATRTVTRRLVEDFLTYAEKLLGLAYDQDDAPTTNRLLFMFYTEVLPGIMRQLSARESRAFRRQYFDAMLGLVTKARRIFGSDDGYSYIDRIAARRSFRLAWIHLVLRYKPRAVLTKNPRLLRFYQTSRRIGLSICKHVV